MKETVYIETFINKQKGNETKFKAYQRSPKDLHTGYYSVKINNETYILHYETNTLYDEDGQPKGYRIADNGMEDALVYRISKEDKEFYSRENADKRNQDIDEAVKYLEDSKEEKAKTYKANKEELEKAYAMMNNGEIIVEYHNDMVSLPYTVKVKNMWGTMSDGNLEKENTIKDNPAYKLLYQVANANVYGRK